jgi:histidinol-phosphatase (PHP family)
MQLANYHTHTIFSDGKSNPKDYIESAIEKGLTAFGFSDHAPVLFDTSYCMPMEKLNNYLIEIDRLKFDFADRIEIYKGLEVDYIPGEVSILEDYIQSSMLDYTIGAVHFVDYWSDGKPWVIEGSEDVFQKGIIEIFEGDIEAVLTRYFGLIREMVQTACPTIVAHLDRIKKQNKGEKYYSEKSSWYKKAVEQTLEMIAESKAILEINTKGVYKGVTDDFYPSTWVLKMAYEMNIPIHLASDCHHPSLITGGFDNAMKKIKKLGFKDIQLLKNGIWQPFEIERKIHFSV